MTHVWSGLGTDRQFQEAREAAVLVYQLVAHARDAGADADPEQVLERLGVPGGVVKAIAHEEHPDTKAKAALIETCQESPDLRMRWSDDTEELWFTGYIGWAGENEDALIRAVTGAHAEVEAFYADERGYAQVRIGFDYSDMTPAELEELLGVINGYRKEGMGGVLYEDTLATVEE